MKNVLASASCVAVVCFVSCRTLGSFFDTGGELPPGISKETVVAWMPFDGTVRDQSLYGNDGVPCGIRFKSGKSDRGLLLAGKQSSYIYYPDQEVYHVAEPTVEAWIKLEEMAPSIALVSETIQGADDDARGYILDIEGGRLRFVIGDSSREWKAVTGSTRLEVNRWYHVAGTFDNGVLKVFVNGQLDGRNMFGATRITYTPRMHTGPNPSVLYIGVRHNAHESPPNYQPDLMYPFSGIIDEVRIYNRALTDSEIRALYMQRLSG
jgi:hypothetical protein